MSGLWMLRSYLAKSQTVIINIFKSCTFKFVLTLSKWSNLCGLHKDYPSVERGPGLEQIHPPHWDVIHT